MVTWAKLVWTSITAARKKIVCFISIIFYCAGSKHKLPFFPDVSIQGEIFVNKKRAAFRAALLIYQNESINGYHSSRLLLCLFLFRNPQAQYAVSIFTVYLLGIYRVGQVERSSKCMVAELLSSIVALLFFTVL